MRPVGSHLTDRTENEVSHGVKLSLGDPEATWGWDSPAGQLRAARRARLLASAAELGPGKRVLEIGCGTGLFTQCFAASGASIVAVDISEPLLQRARERGLSEAQVTFELRSFDACSADGPFDAVIGSSILHHLDIASSLATIRSYLQPGGRVAFAEPNMLNPQIMVQKNIPWVKERLGDSPDETAFIRWPLQRLLADSGFEDVVVTPFDWLHPSTPPVFINKVVEVGARLEHTPVLREFAGSLLIAARAR